VLSLSTDITACEHTQEMNSFTTYTIEMEVVLSMTIFMFQYDSKNDIMHSLNPLKIKSKRHIWISAKFTVQYHNDCIKVYKLNTVDRFLVT
jgi:hypothetical protein